LWFSPCTQQLAGILLLVKGIATSPVNQLDIRIDKPLTVIVERITGM